MKVIGAGVGRTGTMSLRLALQELGLGPCHHMEAVLGDRDRQVPLWNDALDGSPDWASLYDGFHSAVDWPTASFFRELHAAYPDARFVLTVRATPTWVDSFRETIYTARASADQAPDAVKGWFAMATGVIERAGFPLGLAGEDLAAAFDAHNAAVRAAIPAAQLLIFEVKDGWGPLCEFLQVPEPSIPFPRTNNREEFWELVNGANA